MIQALQETRVKEPCSNRGGIRVYMNEESTEFALHRHPEVEIIAALENGYQFEIAGKKRNISQGDMLIIPPGEPHRLYAPACGKRIIILFDCSLLYQFPAFNRTLLWLRPYALVEREKAEKLHAKLFSIVVSIAEEYDSAQACKEAACHALMTNFFVQLSRCTPPQNFEEKNVEVLKEMRYIQSFLEVCEFVDRHCTQNLDIVEVAVMVGYSPYHFARLFKKYMNMTFYSYVTQKRIMHAARLLVTHEFTITQAAHQAGFESLSTFNRAFKKCKNCTPSAYIAMNQSQNK